jgi:hypothetical protein
MDATYHNAKQCLISSPKTHIANRLIPKDETMV